MGTKHCGYGHFCGGETYTGCPVRDKEGPAQEERRITASIGYGFRSLLKWSLYTVAVSGIPLLLYSSLSVYFMPPPDSGVVELAAFFFGVTVPVVFDRGHKNVRAENVLSRLSDFFGMLAFVLLCLYYGYIYIKIFRGGVLTDEERNAYQAIILFFGGICVIMTGGSRFVRGMQGDDEDF